MSKNGASILVVDDEREIVRALRRILSAHGYTVLTASSGEEAVEMVTQHRPDLLFLPAPERELLAARRDGYTASTRFAVA